MKKEIKTKYDNFRKAMKVSVLLTHYPDLVDGIIKEAAKENALIMPTIRHLIECGLKYLELKETSVFKAMEASAAMTMRRAK